MKKSIAIFALFLTMISLTSFTVPTGGTKTNTGTEVGTGSVNFYENVQSKINTGA